MSRGYDSHEKHLARERCRGRGLSKAEIKALEAAKSKLEAKPNYTQEKTMPRNDDADLMKHFQDVFFTVSLDGDMMGAPVRMPAKPKVAEPPPVRWDDIIGQAEAKAAVCEAVEGATKHAERYKRYGRRPTKGVLLFGPPGNGKTMIGKAAAQSIADAAGGRTSPDGFIYVKGPELLSPYVGEAERNVRNLFARARRHKERTGAPGVIFIDEAEALLAHRGGGGPNWTASLCVPSFLAEMDGCGEQSAFVLLATNRANALDSAIVREGRIDRKVFVGRPTREDAERLFAHGLTARPCADTVETLASAAADALYNAAHALYQVQLRGGGSKTITLGDLTSGAQIAFLVEAAATFAIEREIAEDKDDGIRVADFVAAVARTLREARTIEHPAELGALVEPYAADVESIARVREGGTAPKKSLITKLPKDAAVSFVGLPDVATA